MPNRMSVKAEVEMVRKLEEILDPVGLPEFCRVLASICEAKSDSLHEGQDAEDFNPNAFADEWDRRANTFRNLSRKFAGDRIGPNRA